MNDRDEGMKATVTQDFLACHQKRGACRHVEPNDRAQVELKVGTAMEVS